MYNYWNYPKSLLVALSRKIRGKLDPRYIIYRSKFKSNYLDEDKLSFFKMKKGSYLTLDKEDIVVYRIYWADGSISRWFVPDYNDDLNGIWALNYLYEGKRGGE